VLLPSAVQPHAHLDKAFSWAASHAPYGDLPSAIDSWGNYARRLTAEDVDRRARHALTRYLAAGITAVRSHVDLPLDTDDPLCGVRAMLGLREQLRDVLDLQVCLLASSVADTAALERALDLGVDVLGGCPHLADDPLKELTRLLGLAERRGIDVDLHTDEQLNPGMLTIRELARQVSARGLTQRVTASHCVSLGSLDPAALADVLAEVRDAGLAVVTLPITNLYLQGRESAAPVPRGLPAVRKLLAAGVTVAAGGDNVRDPFNPVGRVDPFETTSLLVTAAHLNADQALHAVTDAGRTVLGLPPAGPFRGGLADLVAVRADDVTDVLAGALPSPRAGAHGPRRAQRAGTPRRVPARRVRQAGQLRLAQPRLRHRRGGRRPHGRDRRGGQGAARGRHRTVPRRAGRDRPFRPEVHRALAGGA
jgi:cytosine deaminase